MHCAHGQSRSLSGGDGGFAVCVWAYLQAHKPANQVFALTKAHIRNSGSVLINRTTTYLPTYLAACLMNRRRMHRRHLLTATFTAHVHANTEIRARLYYLHAARPLHLPTLYSFHRNDLDGSSTPLLSRVRSLSLVRLAHCFRSAAENMQNLTHAYAHIHIPVSIRLHLLAGWLAGMQPVCVCVCTRWAAITPCPFRKCVL